MLNHIDLAGRLVRDPELRRTQSGKAVTSFTLACDRDFKADDGPTADFVDVVTWGATAEFVDKYFAKGRMAVVSGRLQIRGWTDKDGNKRRAAEIVADHVYFGDSKRSEPQSDSNDTGLEAPSADFAEIDEDDDSELPFN